MWFGKFLFRSVLLSFPVALFWLPILGITGYVIWQSIVALGDEIVAIIMLGGLFFMPVLAMLIVFAIRGGMTILRSTRGTDLGKVSSVTWRLLRFNFPLMNVIISLFGTVVMLGGMELINNQFLADFERVLGIRSRFQVFFIKEVLLTFPIGLMGGWILGICVAFAAMGVSMAASGAMAVSKPPNHHLIWGVGAQFFNILFVGLVVCMAPFCFAIFQIGGFDAQIKDLLAIDQTTLLIVAGYFIWSICVLCSASAIGYSLNLVTAEESRREAIKEMTSTLEPVEKVDLAALRKSRMQNGI